MEVVNPLGAAGILLLVAYLFVVNSRILDQLPTLSTMRIPMILMLLFAGATVVSGLIVRGLATTGGKLVVALYVWSAISTVFSVWRRGSLDFMKDLSLTVILFLAVVSLVRSLRDLRRVLAAIGASVAVSAILSFLARGQGNRLALAAGSYGDPNGFAAALLFAIPLCFVYSVPGQRSFMGLMGWLATVPMLGAFLQTGSRGGMIAFLLVGVLLFFRVGVKKKIALVLVATVLGGVFLAALPEELRVRYLTLFGTPQVRPGMDIGGADSSSEARLALLLLSIDLTIKNPVFGVGPGMFPVAGDIQAKEDGYARGTWQVTHNTYTQVSSEMGLIGLALFLAILYTGWKRSRVVSRLPAHLRSPELDAMRHMAVVLEFSLLGLCVSSFFLSLFYWMNWAMLTSCMICLEIMARNEVARLERQQKPADGAAVTPPGGAHVPAWLRARRGAAAVAQTPAPAAVQPEKREFIRRIDRGPR